MEPEDFFNTNESVTSVILNWKHFVESEKNVSESGVKEFLKGFGRFFYMVNPAETTFETFEKVPNYYAEVSTYFLE